MPTPCSRISGSLRAVHGSEWAGPDDGGNYTYTAAFLVASNDQTASIQLAVADELDVTPEAVSDPFTIYPPTTFDLNSLYPALPIMPDPWGGARKTPARGRVEGRAKCLH